MAEDRLSQVVAHLTSDQRRRYVDKIEAVGAACDPYLLPPQVFQPVSVTQLAGAAATAENSNAQQLPSIEYGDIYSYLINRDSAYTGQSLKAYKSLEAYKYFVAGFVKEAHCTKTTANKFLLIGKVS
jgi:hypothetical protein